MGSLHVTIIGPYPPPYGGISVHVMRLKAFLVSSGIQVTVLDYANSENSFKGKDVRKLAFLPLHLILSALKNLRGTKARITHIHISAAERYLKIGCLFWMATLGHRTVLTIHSGRLIGVANNMGSKQKTLFGWLVRQFDAVITVSSEQANLLKTKFSVPKERLHVIPAFLPPINTKQKKTVAELSRPIVLAAGYVIPIYGYEVLLSAVEKLINRGLDFETYLVFYTERDPSYAAKIIMQAESLGVKILEAMPPAEFLTLLSRTHVFVRPTFTDGDSNAVREAHWAGAHVVASDAVQRPSWAHCFTTGNAHSLAFKLEQFLQSERPDLSKRDLDHSGEAIQRLYNSLV